MCISINFRARGGRYMLSYMPFSRNRRQTYRRRPRTQMRRKTRRVARRPLKVTLPRSILNPNMTKGVTYNRQNQKILNVVKTEFSQINFVGTGAIQADYLPFTISNMPSIVLYQGLYRKYKVNRITLTFRYLSVESTDDALLPRLFCRYMYDNYQTTPALAGMEGMANVKVVQLDHDTREFKYTFYPKFVVPNYISGTVGSGTALVYGNKYTNGWIDMDDINVLYHGFIYLFTGWPAGQNISMDTTYHVSFKDPI